MPNTEIQDTDLITERDLIAVYNTARNNAEFQMAYEEISSCLYLPNRLKQQLGITPSNISADTISRNLKVASCSKNEIVQFVCKHAIKPEIESPFPQQRLFTTTTLNNQPPPAPTNGPTPN